jgi:hypothetical protein
MTKQVHNRLAAVQVEAILNRYVNKELSAVQAMDMLGLGRSRFFEWVKRYKDRSKGFSTAYRREACNHRISSDLEGYIVGELETEKSLIDDPSMPVRFYNYSFIRDQIRKKHHQEVSVPTIIDRAKKTDSTFRSRKGNIMIGRSSPTMPGS